MVAENNRETDGDRNKSKSTQFKRTPDGVKTKRMLEVEDEIGTTLEEDYRTQYLNGDLGQKRLADRWGVQRNQIFARLSGGRRSWIQMLGLPKGPRHHEAVQSGHRKKGRASDKKPAEDARRGNHDLATAGHLVNLNKEHRSKVFVVHGHDEGASEGVARFLEKIGLDAIVLREQPDRGRTVIEKFEACARKVGFAVVLLTPDDLGGAASTADQMARARQNVIFELGYFAGSLGRGRACLLRKGQVEIPSDLFGVIYTDFDHPSEGWKVKLARELKAAEFDFDDAKVWA